MALTSPGMRPLNDYFLTARITSVAAANSRAFIAVPDDGRIVKIITVLEGVITTADAVITTQINNVAVTNGVITVAQSGSAIGDVDFVEPTGANKVTEGDNIEFEVTTAATGAQSLFITAIISRTAA